MGDKGRKSTDKRKKLKQSKRNCGKAIAMILTVILIAMVTIIGILIIRDLKKKTASDPKLNTERKQESTVEFDDGKLKLTGSMEYEGPDFEDGSMEEGNYTILKIQNISESFLRSASIEVKVNNSEKMSFTIDSLPAGETVMVIGQGYNGYSEKDIYQVTSCESSYEETVVCEKEGLTVSCEAGKIRLNNQTSEDLSGTVFRYKGKTSDMLMGGLTYEFVADSLPSGGTYEIDSQSFLADSVQIVEIK